MASDISRLYPFYTIPYKIQLPDGKVGCDTVEFALIDGKVPWNTDDYTTASLHPDWQYFLWHGINISMTVLLSVINYGLLHLKLQN